MKVVANEPDRLEMGGWSLPALALVAALAVTCLGMVAWMVLEGSWNMIFVVIFTLVVCGAMMSKIELRQRLVFDAGAGEVRLEDLRLLGLQQRAASIGEDARVEVEEFENHDGKPNVRRMVFVDGETRMPLSKLHQLRKYDAPAEVMNTWLRQHLGRG